MQRRVPEAAAARDVDVRLDVGTNGERNVADIVFQTQDTVDTYTYYVIVVVLVVAVIVVAAFPEADVATNAVVPLQAGSVESRGMLLVQHSQHGASVLEAGAQDALNGGIALDEVFHGKAGSSASSQADACGVATLCLCADNGNQHKRQSER